MANFTVTYDLNGPHPTHAEMDKHLQKLGGAHARILETVWYVGCWLTHEQLRDYLLSNLTQNDQIWVAETKEAAWSNLLCDGTWLKSVWQQYR